MPQVAAGGCSSVPCEMEIGIARHQQQQQQQQQRRSKYSQAEEDGVHE
jgi:hypothetical protein